jgi:WD40 repeat protein
VRLDRVVALKMILAGSHAGPEDLRRFRIEAEAAARLQHPNIIQVYEVGEHQGLPFLSLEYCPGGSLDRKLRGQAPAQEAGGILDVLARAMQAAQQRGLIRSDVKPADVLKADESTPLAAAEAAALVETLARAMHAAHAKGVLHRDLKPANVLLAEDGTPKITDFGLARKVDDVRKTASGAVLGTPSYMAPEQASGKTDELGPATDVWALGAILYECLTGRPPFRAPTSLDTLLQVMGDEPVSLRQLRPEVPPDLETICHKCLQKEPARRYTSALDLAEDLARFRVGEAIAARPVGWWGRTRRWCRRNSATVALATGSLLLLLLGTLAAALYGVYAGINADEADVRAKAALGEARAAREAEWRAREAESQARREARASRQREYDAYMQLAQSAWQNNQMPRFFDCLERQKPIAEQEDLRSFEWHYWKNRQSRPPRVLRGHTGAVRCVAFSPNAQYLASAGSDGAIKVWEADKPLVFRTLEGHLAEVTSLAFGPDGQRLTSLSIDGTLRIWALRDAGSSLVLRTPPNAPGSGALSPSGQRLASVGANHGVLVWDLDRAGQTVFVLRGHTDHVRSIAFTGDGQRLASASDDGTVRVWDVAAGQEIANLSGHQGGALRVACSSDGKRIAVGTAGPQGSVKIWDATTGQALFTLKGHEGDINALAFSPNGKRLASGSADRTVKVWDMATGQELLSLKDGDAAITSVAFSPNGGRLAAANTEGVVRVWDGTPAP